MALFLRGEHTNWEAREDQKFQYNFCLFYQLNAIIEGKFNLFEFKLGSEDWGASGEEYHNYGVWTANKILAPGMYHDLCFGGYNFKIIIPNQPLSFVFAHYRVPEDPRAGFVYTDRYRMGYFNNIFYNKPFIPQDIK